MKNIVLLISLMFASQAIAVCSTPITRTNFATLEKLTSTRLNTELNTIYTHANELPGDCITDETVTSSKIDDGTIVNADISASAAIAPAKLAAPNYAISTSSGSFDTSSGTAVDVTNLSVSLTTTGKPVEIYLTTAEGVTGAVSVANSGTNSIGVLHLYRGVTLLADFQIGTQGATSAALASSFSPGMIRYLDVPAAGTYTYKIQANGSSSSTIFVSNTRLVAREL